MNAEIHTFVFNYFISLNSRISPQKLLCEMLLKLHQLNLIKLNLGCRESHATQLENLIELN